MLPWDGKKTHNKKHLTGSAVGRMFVRKTSGALEDSLTCVTKLAGFEPDVDLSNALCGLSGVF